MHKLREESGSYYIEYPARFRPNGYLSEKDVHDCFLFAYNMTFGSKGQHRNHRSGGNAKRHNGEIFADTFQGKMAEYAFYNMFSCFEMDLEHPDIRCMGLNEWDNCDFKVNNKEIAIKSTKFYGNLLLLETKDWDEEGRYKPNYGTEHAEYDYFVLERIKPEATSIMKRNRWLYSDELSLDELWPAFMNENWTANIAGYISREELVSEVIKGKLILPQKSSLNGNTSMDAENYYAQAGDLHPISKLIQELREIVD